MGAMKTIGFVFVLIGVGLLLMPRRAPIASEKPHAAVWNYGTAIWRYELPIPAVGVQPYPGGAVYIRYAIPEIFGNEVSSVFTTLGHDRAKLKTDANYRLAFAIKAAARRDLDEWFLSNRDRVASVLDPDAIRVP